MDSNLNVYITISPRGVSRVVAVGRSAEDRSRALDFLTRIDPELAAIDRAAKIDTTHGLRQEEPERIRKVNAERDNRA